MSNVLSTAGAWYTKLPVSIQKAVRAAGATFIGAEVVLIPAVLAAPSVSTQEQLFLAGTFSAGAAAARLVGHAVGVWLEKQ